MGVRYDERYGFVDDRTGDILRSKILSAAPPKYRVWDVEGGVWEATGESRPAQVERINLQRPFGYSPQQWGATPAAFTGGGSVSYDPNSNAVNWMPAPGATIPTTSAQVRAYREAVMGTGLRPTTAVPLTQVWTFARVPRPEPPIIRGDDKGLANDFLIGCDPEAAALRKYTRSEYDGNLPTPSIRDVETEEPVNLADYGLSYEGPVGYDHNGRVLEIRPSPFRGAYALTKEIQKIINHHPSMVSLKSRGLKLRAGAMVVRPGRRSLSLGGHIHLGVDPAKKDLVNALDRVTGTLERLDVLPSHECRQRREGEYGHFGDTRSAEDHFGDLRVEYRTMPSWLYDPKVTFIALTAAKLAALDPAHALEMLPQRTSVGWQRLRTWVDGFKDKDENAARLAGILEVPIEAAPDENVFEVWERPLEF
jgi:hypothetical protein